MLDLCGVRRNPGAKAWQVTCPFHANGAENHPSARAYNDSNKLWCFTEDKQFDVVDIVMHTQNLDLRGAVAWLNAKFKVDETQPVKSERREEDVELRNLELKLRVSKGKVDLHSYQEIAYALTRTAEDELDISARKVRLGKIVVALDRITSVKSSP